MLLIKLWLRGAFKHSAYQILVGRYRNREKPAQGRFTPGEVDNLLTEIWCHLNRLLPEADLEQYKNLGTVRTCTWPLPPVQPVLLVPYQGAIIVSN